MGKGSLVALALAATLGIGCGTVKTSAPVIRPTIVRPVKKVKQTVIKPTAVEKKTSEIYGDKIFYENFFLTDAILSNDKIALPSDLEMRLKANYVDLDTIKTKTFDNLVWQEAAKLGYTRDKISSINASEAIMLAVNLVAKRFSYVDVDNDKEFQRINGKMKSLEFYFRLGKGECQRYASSFIYVFDLFKGINDNLKNIYATNRDLANLNPPHDWNVLVFMHKDKIVISHIDPTWYDTGGVKDLQGERGIHVPKDRDYFLGKFFYDIKDFKSARPHFEKAYSTIEQKIIDFKSSNLHPGDPIEFRELVSAVVKRHKTVQARLLMRLSHSSSELKEWKDTMEVMRRYEILKTDDYKDDVLYFSYKAAKALGETKAAMGYRFELITKYPTSTWTWLLRKSFD